MYILYKQNKINLNPIDREAARTDINRCIGSNWNMIDDSSPNFAVIWNDDINSLQKVDDALLMIGG